jgi:hypothetical protein
MVDPRSAIASPDEDELRQIILRGVYLSAAAGGSS